MMGAQVDGPEQREFNALQVDLWPRVSWSPSFAMTFADLEVSAQHCFVQICLGARSIFMAAAWQDVSCHATLVSHHKILAQ